MARAESGTVVAVEVLIKKNVVAPVWVGLKFLGAPVHWTATMLIAQKGRAKPAGYLVAHFKEVHHVAGLGGALDLKIVAVIQIKLKQRPNYHDIYRKPHRAPRSGAPVSYNSSPDPRAEETSVSNKTVRKGAVF
jgi:hypothetical protein